MRRHLHTAVIENAGPGGGMAAYAAGASGLARAIGLNSKAARVAVAVVVLGLVAAIAFVAGERRASHPMVLTGIPVIGQANVATVTVGGWSYGIEGSVTWYDSQGAHLGSWPSCLSNPNRPVPITFGAIPVAAPEGGTWRQVVWVKCPG
jgi:hypothetical protein